MTKWEYSVRTLSYGATIENVLNKFGDDGWELVTAGMQYEQVVCYLKRVKPETSVQWRD